MLITLHRYVLRELLKALGLALVVFGFVLLVVPVAQMIRDGVGVWTTLTNIPKMLPLISPMLLPLMIIASMLVCYGRLAGQNEHTAVQASGINPFWLAMPGLLIAFLATIITLFLNDTLLTSATADIKRSILSAKTEILRRRLSRPGSFLFHNAAFVRLKREGDQAGIDITFFAKGDEDRTDDQDRWDPAYPHQVTRVIARDHDIDLLEAGDGDLYVQTRLRSFQRLDLGGSELQTINAETAEPKWKAGSGDDEVQIDPNRITYWGFRLLVEKLKERRNSLNEMMDEIQMLEKDGISGDDKANLKRLNGRARGYQKSINKITAELHFKLAMSFSCMSFALLGIPLGLRNRTQRPAIGFAIGFVVAIVFFLAMKGLQNGASGAMTPHALIWLPDLALLVAGGILWYRVRRAD